MCNNWWIGGCAILYEALHTLTINFLRKSMNFSKNKILWKINPQIEENLLCLNPGDYRAQCTMLGNLFNAGKVSFSNTSAFVSRLGRGWIGAQ